MKKFSILGLMLLFLAFGVSGASATTVLWDWAFNVNGDFYNYFSWNNLDDVPDLDHDFFDFDDGSGIGTGTGSLSWQHTATEDIADFFFIAWFDHEFEEPLGGSGGFLDEYGPLTGTPGLGQSYEIAP